MRVGHSSALLSSVSYRNGAFFFQVLYSSLISFCSVTWSSHSMDPAMAHIVSYWRVRPCSDTYDRPCWVAQPVATTRSCDCLSSLEQIWCGYDGDCQSVALMFEMSLIALYLSRIPYARKRASRPTPISYTRTTSVHKPLL